MQVSLSLNLLCCWSLFSGLLSLRREQTTSVSRNFWNRPRQWLLQVFFHLNGFLSPPGVLNALAVCLDQLEHLLEEPLAVVLRSLYTLDITEEIHEQDVDHYDLVAAKEFNQHEWRAHQQEKRPLWLWKLPEVDLEDHWVTLCWVPNVLFEGNILPVETYHSQELLWDQSGLGLFIFTLWEVSYLIFEEAATEFVLKVLSDQFVILGRASLFQCGRPTSLQPRLSSELEVERLEIMHFIGAPWITRTEEPVCCNRWYSKVERPHVTW